MSKKKNKSNNIIMPIISIVLAVLTYVSLAFKFMSITIGSGSLSTTSNYSFSDWWDFGSSLEWYVTAKTFLTATLVVVGVIAILAILKILLNNGLFRLLLKIAGLAAIIVSLVFLVAFIVTCVKWSNDLWTYGPHIGAILLGVFGMATGITGLLSADK